MNYINVTSLQKAIETKYNNDDYVSVPLTVIVWGANRVNSGLFIKSKRKS